MKKLFAIIMLFLFAPVTVNATIGPLFGMERLTIDGERFYVWGVFMDYSTSRYRLRDMAYILNGTPAQFNIRETDDDRLHYWIVRGEPYTPRGDELQPIESFDCCCGSDVSWWGGYFYDISAVIGLDGTDEPATAIALIAAISDDGEFFICIYELARVLGFSVDWSRQMHFWVQEHDFYVEDVDYVITTTGEPAVLADKPVEFLYLMLDLSGHWVDAVYFESTVIDESVAWPVELHFHARGAGVSNYSWNTVAPLRGGSPTWYDVSFHKIEDGCVEITVTDSRRIVVDMSERAYELTYYIEDTPHRMIRHEGGLRQFYQVEPLEGGGVRLRYLLGQQLWAGEGFAIYRSQSRFSRGERVFHQARVPHYHNVEFISPWSYDNRSVLFEFIDTDVSRGVYYYTFYTNMWGSYHAIVYDGAPWRIMVDMAALFPQEEVAETEEPIEEAEVEEAVEADETASMAWLWILLPVFMFAAGFVMRKK